LKCTFDCQSDPVRFWRTDGGDPYWSLHVDYLTTPPGGNPRANFTQVTVRGMAVWMLPRGANFEHQVEIRTDQAGRNCLVIVTGERGVRFNGGLKAGIPVILISSGQVAIRHENESWGATVNSYATDLSVFAGSVSLMGPCRDYWDGGAWGHNTMQLHHPTDGLLESEYIAFFMLNGALPNAGSSTGHALALRSGTWRVSAQ
jgi:hypothetical protein